MAGTGIERSDGVALWRQIADLLRGEILAGAHPAGERLPPETVLADRFGVNRHTLRRAIASLAAEGLVQADQGKGTFVRGGRLAYPIGRRTRFSEIVSREGRQPGGRLVASATVPADVTLASALGVPKGTPLIRLETLSVADGVPISLAESWFPAERFPDLVSIYAETGSITEALRRHGVADYERTWTRITARPASRTECERLGLATGATVLVTDSPNTDATGAAAHYASSRFAADRVEIFVRPGE